MISRHGKKTRTWRMSLTGVLVLTLALALHNAGAQALSPHTPILSTGQVIESTGMEQTSHGQNSYRGTGRPTELHPIESQEEFEDLANLPALGDDGRETIIGADGRVLVNPTTSFPARAVALVTFTGGRCTGWLYGPNIVATAGHCVHEGPGGTWRSNVVVYPGRNGTSSPYGSCTAKWLGTVSGWTSSGSEEYDYGVIKLNCSIGNTTGWFGWWWQSARLTGLSTTISGYPGDKNLTQWKSLGSVGATATRQIFYQNDTYGGMSGSPVYQLRASGSSPCSGYCTMAIHAYGLHGGAPHSTHNHGTRITSTVSTNLLNWRNAP